MTVSATVLVACADEIAEEGMRLERLGLELGMKLARQEKGVGGDLHDLDVGGVGCGSRKAEAGAGEDGLVLAVEFVAVSMALGDLGRAVRLGR